ncbi:hypothetical protein MWU76_16920, partial [Gelidibacter sp. F2691]|nr:hypothetical protein [Gelidibacter sp. F2691]
IHDNGMLHRDISPDNILVDEYGEPILIDFGAAREQAANRSAALLTLRVIKDGYSPHEFYARGADQDTTSDLYVLAATLYHAISGERPIDGKTRQDAFNAGQDDPYIPLAGRFEGYPDGFLEALDKAMEVHVVNRVQSALEWLRMFRGPAVVFEEFGYRPSSVIVALERPDETDNKGENAEAIVSALLASEGDLTTAARSEGLAQPEPERDPSVTVVKSSSGGGSKAIIGVVALLALGAGGYFAMKGSGNDEVTPATEITAVNTAPVALVPTIEPTPIEEPAVTATEEPAEAEAEIAEAPAAAAPAAESEPVATEQPTETASTVPVNLQEQQVSFAHWDVEIPFATSVRRLSTGSAVVITGVDPKRDMSIIGDWVSRGTVIFAVNGQPVSNSSSIAARALEKLEVNPDGHIRAVARYRANGATRAQNGLLALPAVRIFGLENGVGLSARKNAKDGWDVEVTRIPAEMTDGLQQGDVLLAEATTDQSINEVESLDRILETLVADGVSQARLTVLRNGREVQVSMQLAGGS